MSRVDALDEPDFMLLDLDPQSKCPFDRVVEAALTLRQLLEEAGLEGFPKTSGARGLHIYVPLARGYHFDQTRTLAQIFAQLAAGRRPDLFTMARTVEKRDPTRVYVDHPQNRRGATIATPYVLRAYPGAPVATPLTWDELRPGLIPQRFNIRTIFPRLEERGDLFAPTLERKQRLEEPLARLERMMQDQDRR